MAHVEDEEVEGKEKWPTWRVPEYLPGDRGGGKVAHVERKGGPRGKF